MNRIDRFAWIPMIYPLEDQVPVLQAENLVHSTEQKPGRSHVCEREQILCYGLLVGLHGDLLLHPVHEEDKVG